jgi:hypothetical protein
MNKRICAFFTGLFLTALLGGCTTTENTITNEEGDTYSASPSLGVPYSRGPSGPPHVDGPLEPPPSAEAVTEVEEIEFSLPLKSEAEF